MSHILIHIDRCFNTTPGEDYGETVVRYIEEQVLGKIITC